MDGGLTAMHPAVLAAWPWSLAGASTAAMTPAAATAAAVHQRAGTLDEGDRGGVAAVRGEDRGQDRDPEHAPQRVQRVVGAGRHADVGGRDRR